MSVCDGIPEVRLGLKMQFCRLYRGAQIKVSIIWIMQDAAIKLLDMILTQTFTELRGRNPSATEPCLRALNRPGVPFVALRATRTRMQVLIVGNAGAIPLTVLNRKTLDWTDWLGCLGLVWGVPSS